MLKGVLKLFSRKNNLLLFLLFVVLLVPHFLWLREFPVGINHDEVDVMLSAKTFWKFGTDLSGVPFPKSLVATKTDAGLSGLPSFLMAPLMIFPTDLVSYSRIIYVFLAVLITVFITLCIWEFTKDKRFAVIAFFISLINPWLFFYSRSPTEAPWSLLFCLIGIYILFKLKRWKMLYSVIFFAASFYSYQGAKLVTLVFVPLILFARLYSGDLVKKKILLVFFGLFMVGTGLFFVGTKIYGGGILNQRGKEVTFLNISKFEQITYDQRRVSLSFPGKYLYFNKYANFVRTSIEKYIGSLSPSLLFLHGDEFVPFSEHGLLYPVDLVLIILGLIQAGRKGKNKKTLFAVTLALFLSAPISSAMSFVGNQYIFRSFLLIPAFIVLISLGVEYLIDISHAGFWLKSAIYIVLGLSFVNFLIFFFFRYSVDQQENHFLMERVLGSYVERADGIGSKVYVVTDFPYRVFYEYAFFSDYFDKVSSLTIFGGNLYKYKGITITDKCPDANTGTIILKEGLNCKTNGKSYTVIDNPKDTGTAYKIYGDTLCRKSNLTRWRENGTVSDYNIERMSNDEFCLRWINLGN